MKDGVDAHRLIVRGGGSAAIGYAIRFGARLLFLFIAARLFGAALFGAYSLAVAVVELGAAAGGLGLKRLLFKRLDEDRSGRPSAHVLLDAAFVAAAASLGLAAALMLLLALPPVWRLAGETAPALAIVAPMIAGQALLDIFLAATRWKHRMRYDVLARSLVEPYAALAVTAAAWLAGFEQTGLLIGYWGGTLAALAYAAAGARRSLGGFGLGSYRLPRGTFAAILRDSRAATATDLAAGLFARLDLYLVGLILGEAPAGIYNLARQMRTPIRQARQAFDGLLTPVVAKTLAAHGPIETGAAVASASRLILAIQLPMAVGLAAIGLPLLGWFGPEFAAGYWALVFLAAAETILGAFGISELIFLYREPAVALRITLATILVNLVLGAALIVPLGVTGAALAVLAATAAGAAMRRRALRSRFDVRMPLHYSAAPVASAMVAAGAAGLALLAMGSASEAAAAGVALAAALLAYAAALKLWLRATGDSLALVKFKAD
ncbi:MAG TPA: oligosaccharide flippase family protein [Allosphingosinicella sp.]|nr:oligosaccharide flippase family protein [Allosphingosinicella sp.]